MTINHQWLLTRSALAGIAALGLLSLVGCGNGGQEPAGGAPEPGTTDRDRAEAQAYTATAGLPPEQEAFWERLQAHCGKAYAGRVVDVTYFYEDALADREMAMWVMRCDEDRIHIPFYVDDNRSRNWIITRQHDTLRLKHDHRYPDGTEEAISQYGGDAPRPGLPTRQIFPSDAHTGAILPDRRDNFWFFDFVDDDTLQYGVHWRRFGHSVRVEFDLSAEIEPPPKPWGYETGEAAVPDELSDEAQAFWDRMVSHCGNAYRGSVDDATHHYEDTVAASEMVIHFLECTDERIHIPFHVDDDRSRNWILTKVDGTIRLKHDHRNPDGTEEDISQYGGDAPRPGVETRQYFPADAHTAEILPERADNFWFFDFIDDDTLQYGVHWPTAGHSVRASFDLSAPVETPPLPWGYDD